MNTQEVIEAVDAAEHALAESPSWGDSAAYEAVRHLCDAVRLLAGGVPCRSWTCACGHINASWMPTCGGCKHGERP